MVIRKLRIWQGDFCYLRFEKLNCFTYCVHQSPVITTDGNLLTLHRRLATIVEQKRVLVVFSVDLIVDT